MAKFKVGDKIKAGEGSNVYKYTSERNNYKGVVLDINKYDEIKIEYVGSIGTKCTSWVDPKYFDLIEEAKPEQAKPKYPKVIENGKVKIVFNPPYTIVINGDAKGKAKCSPQDEYDPIIGLELAMSRLEKPYMKHKKTVYARDVKGDWIPPLIERGLSKLAYEYTLQKQFEKELFKSLLSVNPIKIADIIKVPGK